MPLVSTADIRSIRLRELIAYLDSKRVAGGPPERENLDPMMEVPRLTPYLMLVERHETGRHRVRLSGTRTAEMLGKDYTGAWVDEIPVDSGREWWDSRLDPVFAAEKTVSGFDQAPCEARKHIMFEWLGQRLHSVPASPAVALFGFDMRPRLPGMLSSAS